VADLQTKLPSPPRGGVGGGGLSAAEPNWAGLAQNRDPPHEPPTPSPSPRGGGELDVVTFGCRLNAYESDAIRAQGQADGAGDTVVFNTCAVTAEAVRQARQAIRKARRERPGARLVVTGCAAQIDPASFAAMDEVDLVLGNGEKAAPRALTGGGSRVRVGDIMGAHPPSPLRGGVGGGGLAADEATTSPAQHLREPPTPGPSPRGGGVLERARAYVEIQNGCDHRCTFCIIPFGRGNSRSVAAEEVARRVRTLADEGLREVVLTGVDLTSWGADLPETPSLGHLVTRILAEVPQLPRLRLSSIDAAEIDAELLAAFAREPRLAPHLHLSLQSGDDLILKRMKRRHSRTQALELIAAVRAARADVAFGADFIAGFPTETEAAFENTLAFVEAAGLAYLHVFPYSPRPGTPAARMPQVPRDVAKARAARLREAGDAALARHLDRQVSRRIEALVERPGRARAADFTEICFDGEAEPGTQIEGRIVAHDGRRARLAL
jgi:threonylcarbamoyladenosine tRNA methylthiotransferase MtaB